MRGFFEKHKNLWPMALVVIVSSTYLACSDDETDPNPAVGDAGFEAGPVADSAPKADGQSKDDGAALDGTGSTDANHDATSDAPEDAPEDAIDDSPTSNG